MGMSEHEEAILLANKILDRTSADPDDDLAILSRQFLRAEERSRLIDNVYRERNRLVALLAWMYPSGLKRTEIKGWDPEWQNCVYIDTPEGQLSWHYHDNEAYLFEGLPPYRKPWDGHTTEEKYARIAQTRDALKEIYGNKEEPVSGQEMTEGARGPTSNHGHGPGDFDKEAASISHDDLHR